MKTKLTTLLTLLICLSAFAQKNEKLKALKVAHITEHLDLTEQEAQAFWPIYNNNEKARLKHRQNVNILKKKEDVSSFTEAEAKNFIDSFNTMEETRFKQDKAYRNKLLTVLPAKKVIALMRAEHHFRKKMIKEFKERHRKGKKDKWLQYK